MHVEYDEPFYLRADEFRRILLADVPAELQWAKDMFVLNCALGCRIGDLKKLSKALRRLLAFCGIDRPVCLYDPEVGDNVYRPLYEVASSKLARKTHVDMLNKVQINYYAAGLHREGSKAVFRNTSLELSDRFALLNAAFGEEEYRV